MEILKRALTSLLVLSTLAACDRVTITDVIKLETDTYIDSSELANHSELDYVRISRSDVREERIILKFPTGKRDNKQTTEEILSNPLALPLFPYIIFVTILESILDCRQSVLKPENLVDAKLILDVTDNQQGTLTGAMSLQLLAKPWWQNATWESAHYFSSKGRWSEAGGDVDAGFTPISNTSSSASVEWDITQYFKTLITTQSSVHYGMLVKATGSTMSAVSFASTQNASTTKRPRIVATYTGDCVKSSTRPGEPRTFYLGAPVQE